MPTDPMERLLETVRPTRTDIGSNPQAVLHAAFDAVVHGDYERFAELITEGAELNIVGFGPIDGNWRGRNEVVAGTRP